MNDRAIIIAACIAVLAQSAVLAEGLQAPPPDPAAIKKFVADIKNLPDANPKLGPKELSAHLQVLERGRTLVTSPAGIQEFREGDNLEVIIKLVKLALLEDRPIRINATLILANVVDNTTACGVINALFDDVNENALFNLLQVVQVVAGYAVNENRQWITELNKRLRDKLDKQKFAKSLALLDQIDKTLSGANVHIARAQLRQLSAPSFDACRELPNLKSIELR